MTKELIQAAQAEIRAGRPAFLVSIASATGSAPRAAGAMMLVGKGGLIGGTIGGGLLEHRCMEEAQAALSQSVRPAGGASGVSMSGFLRSFILDNRTAGGLGMICGGNTEVLFTPLLTASEETLKRASELLEQGEPCALMLPLDGSPFLSLREGRPFTDSLRKPQIGSENGRPFLSVPLTSVNRVFLFGGGHVAAELAVLLKQLDFPFLTADDRPEFSDSERFPEAAAALTVSFSPEALKKAFCGPLAPRREDAFCIMTRGHEGDTQALRFALCSPASYIGVMGSRKKRETVFSLLESEGFSEVRKRVITPIGLDIGAQTPAEIAVSVAAQLIAWRAGRL